MGASPHFISAMDQPILGLKNLSKTFPGQLALDQVDLKVYGGSIHALLGHNGSGKSTLIKLLSGFEKADYGYSAFLNGQRVDLWNGSKQNSSLIRIVHQDLGLVQNLNTIENLAFGRGYHTNAIGSINWKKEGLRAQELLNQLGIVPDVRKPTGMLSRAEQTYIAIARALQDWSDYAKGLMILDEPTASLQYGEIVSLFETMRMIRDKGAGLLYVSHRLDEIFQIADYVTVLRDGEKIHSGPITELDKSRLTAIMTKSEKKPIFGISYAGCAVSISDFGTKWAIFRNFVEFCRILSRRQIFSIHLYRSIFSKMEVRFPYSILTKSRFT